MAAKDLFKSFYASLESPATNMFEVTPNDSAELANATRAVYIGGAGDLKIKTTGGDTVTLVGVPAGSLLPLRVVQVLSTGTTATSIVGMY
jgi:hypothetical protein